MLVYADGPPAPRAHIIPPPQIRLQIRHLDLAQPPAAILAHIAELAEGMRSPAPLGAAAEFGGLSFLRSAQSADW